MKHANGFPFPEAEIDNCTDVELLLDNDTVDHYFNYNNNNNNTNLDSHVLLWPNIIVGYLME